LEKLGWALLSAAIPLEILMFLTIFTSRPRLFFGSLVLFGISGFLGLYLVCRNPKRDLSLHWPLLSGGKTTANPRRAK